MRVQVVWEAESVDKAASWIGNQVAVPRRQAASGLQGGPDDPQGLCSYVQIDIGQP